MTGLRLGDFQRVGLEARTGVIEQTGAPGKEKLANTGTGWAKFTEGLASLFSRSAANAQRQVAAQNRQQAALDSFRAALTDRYGETVADAALQRAGLHPGATSMTWAQGSRALGTAEALAQHHRAITRGHTLDHLSRGPDGGFSDAFRAVCQARGVDPGTLSRAQLRAYDRSFREAVQMRSDGGNVRLSHDDVQRLASQSLRRVAALGDVGLAEAGRRREAFVQCIGKAIAQVAGGADGGRVAATLKEANEALVAWMAAEGEEVSADAVKEFRDLGMNEAIGRLSDPGMARRALRVGLEDPGSLRAVAPPNRLSIPVTDGERTPRQVAMAIGVTISSSPPSR